MEKEKSLLAVKNILLIKSLLSREDKINFLDIEHNTSCDLIFLEEKKPKSLEDHISININLKIVLKGVDKKTEKEQFKIETTFNGSFEIQNITNELEKLEEQFKNVNAPAILFPFVREHICSLSSKAGLGNILLPTVNFVEKWDKTKQKNSVKK